MTDNPNATLLACPFCGGDAEMLDAFKAYFWVQCHNCLNKASHHLHHEDAITAWNTRLALNLDGVALDVWPDFTAPPKFKAPDPRWTDPGLPDFRLIWKLAREVGYAVGLHGSMVRDCDLIAAPWTEDAVSAEELIAHLCKGLDAFEMGMQTPEPAQKPQGRLAWCLQIRDAYKKVLDISVMPRAIRAASPETTVVAAMRVPEIAAVIGLLMRTRRMLHVNDTLARIIDAALAALPQKER